MSNFKARIDPLSKEEAIKRAEEHGLPTQIAELNIFRVLLRHPVLAKEINSSLLMLLFIGNKLSHRARELIIMRLGWATGSEYEWSQHWPIAKDFGVDEPALLATRDWKNSSDLSDADKAVLAATDDTLENGFVSEATWQQIVANYGTVEEQLEILAAIANWRSISQILLSLEIPLDEGMESWPPDGLTPN
jgi:alkylhydroperoxidase family enzyme